MTTRPIELLELDAVLELSHDPDPKRRAGAVRVMCPCQLKMDLPRVWDRLIEMARDGDVHVRKHVVLYGTDPSPGP